MYGGASVLVLVMVNYSEVVVVLVMMVTLEVLKTVLAMVILAYDGEPRAPLRALEPEALPSRLHRTMPSQGQGRAAILSGPGLSLP